MFNDDDLPPTQVVIPRLDPVARERIFGYPTAPLVLPPENYFLVEAVLPPLPSFQPMSDPDHVAN